MRARLDELLSTLEALTAEAGQPCANDMTHALVLIRVRHAGITELCELVTHGEDLTEADVARMRAIEAAGAALQPLIQAKGEELRDTLRAGGLQRSFAKCLEGVLSHSQ